MGDPYAWVGFLKPMPIASGWYASPQRAQR